MQMIDLARQRDRPPVQLRLAHVHPDLTVAAPFGPQTTACGDQRQMVGPKVAHQMVGHTAGGIAAGPGLAAVGIPEHQPETHPVGIGDLGQLVKPHTPVPIAQRPRKTGRHPRPMPARVDHDKIVACTVHFQERQARWGEVILHAPAYTPVPGVLKVPDAFCP